MKRAGVCASALVLNATSVMAQPAAAPDAGTAPPIGACVEVLPGGKQRPTMLESFPQKGLSGYANMLEVRIQHGKGETVLPSGFRLERDSDAVRALEKAGFVLPDPDGGAGPSRKSAAKGEQMETRVAIPFVPLPPKPGRNLLELPPMPITIQRASGELVTLCTKPHAITVEDPTANVPDPKPKPNPPPRRQLEVWTAAKQVALGALVALLVGALVAWLIAKWLRRPKPAPPPAPPRPPWEVALEELFDIKNAGLIKQQRYAVHFERVSNAIRKYLGERFGFDGLECTTRETLSLLREVRPDITVLPSIEAFLREADLVKFARLTPTEEQCEHALLSAEQVVRKTVPAPGEAGPAQASDRPSEPEPATGLAKRVEPPSSDEHKEAP
jgi:hypothetical protein